AGKPKIGEASPTYLGDSEALARIGAVLPEAKLIAMVRDPVERAYSHYWHWRLQFGEARSFEECVAHELGEDRSTGADGDPAIPRAMVRMGEPYPPMTAEMRARLGAHYAPHNEALAAWLGRDLSRWSAA